MLISSRCEFMMQLTARFSQLTVSDIDMENALCYIITSEPKGGVDMKLSVEQIPYENEEELCRNSMLFRRSKSMILNADKIQYVRPSVSGRFEATLTNNEKVIISRQYVGELKRLLGM